MTIGQPAIVPFPLTEFNSFDGLRNGVLAERSNLSFYNNVFQNLEGYGIQSLGTGSGFET